jgi:transcription factor SOX7/8/10/18 (SOX group E/F)
MIPNWQSAPAGPSGDCELGLDDEWARRPPNAFILYSQQLRTAVRQENPALSNNEVSRLLGKMWKEVSPDVKLHYKQQAAAAQNDFKQQHPNYTYRKAKRKRALNELLTKNTQGFPGGPFPTDPAMANQAYSAANAYFSQICAQGTPHGGFPTGQMPQYGLPNAGIGQPQGFPGFAGYPGLGDPNASLYQMPPK